MANCYINHQMVMNTSSTSHKWGTVHCHLGFPDRMVLMSTRPEWSPCLVKGSWRCCSAASAEGNSPRLLGIQSSCSLLAISGNTWCSMANSGETSLSFYSEKISHIFLLACPACCPWVSPCSVLAKLYECLAWMHWFVWGYIDAPNHHSSQGCI